MENLALLFPYLIIAANVGLLGGIVCYMTYCTLGKSCPRAPLK